MFNIPANTDDNSMAGPSSPFGVYSQPQPVLPFPSNTWLKYGSDKSLFIDITNAHSKHDKVPPLLCVQAALAVGALVLQDQITVERPGDGTSIPVSQLIIGIAESGERKSKIMSEFMSPVTAYLKAYEKQYAEKWRRYSEALEHWEKTRTLLVNASAKAHATQLAE